MNKKITMSKSSHLNDTKNENDLLNYILRNCLFAYEELCKINKNLLRGMNLDSNANVNRLGAMNRMIQDYLIIRVGGLFDKTKYKTKQGVNEVVSFEKLFSNNNDFKRIKEEKIIKYIIKQRHNFVAHINKNHVDKGDWPITAEICNSNIRELLENLQQLLKNNDSVKKLSRI